MFGFKPVSVGQVTNRCLKSFYPRSLTQLKFPVYQMTQEIQNWLHKHTVMLYITHWSNNSTDIFVTLIKTSKCRFMACTERIFVPLIFGV